MPDPEYRLVGDAGLEPARYRYQRILSPSRLPLRQSPAGINDKRVSEQSKRKLAHQQEPDCCSK